MQNGALVGPPAKASSALRSTRAEGGNSVMTTTKRRFSVLVAVTAVTIAVGGCASDGNDPPASQSPSPTSPAPTSNTSTPPSQTEIASEAASSMVRQYFETVGQVRQNPQRPASDLDAVASSTQLTAQKNLLKSQRADGLHQTGMTQVVKLNVQSVSLDDPATAVIDVCWDVSGVDVIDRSGKSVVPPERKEVGWTRFTVTNDRWETAPDDGWRVSGGSDLEKEPCVGS